MSQIEEGAPREDKVEGIDDEVILRDLESRYANVLCPIHGERPKFDMDKAGALIEVFCCEALGQIFRELREKEDAGEPRGEGAPLVT